MQRCQQSKRQDHQHDGVAQANDTGCIIPIELDWVHKMSKLRALFVVVICFFSANSTAEDFANCIINKMQGVQNDAAANAVLNLCKEENGGGFDSVEKGSGRGMFSFESGNECTIKKAKDIRSQIAANFVRAACRVLYDEPPIVFQQKVSKTKEETDLEKQNKELEKVLRRTMIAYPFLNHQSPNANKQAIDAVVARRDIYLGKGYALPDALTKAVNEIGPMYAAKQNEVGQSKKSTRQEKAPQTWVEMKEIRARGCNPSGVMTDEEMARCR